MTFWATKGTLASSESSIVCRRVSHSGESDIAGAEEADVRARNTLAQCPVTYHRRSPRVDGPCLRTHFATWDRPELRSDWQWSRRRRLPGKSARRDCRGGQWLHVEDGPSGCRSRPHDIRDRVRMLLAPPVCIPTSTQR